jgi:hypothetical protein
VDSDRARAAGGQQLAKELSITQLIAIGACFFFLFCYWTSHDLYGTRLRVKSASFGPAFPVNHRCPRLKISDLSVHLANSEKFLVLDFWCLNSDCWSLGAIFCKVL